MIVTKKLAASLYVAVFSRAPDQAGLDFWVGKNFLQMAEGFMAHPVFTEQYGAKNNAEFIHALYENLLQGQGDTAGVAFWVDLLDQGVPRAEVLTSFIDASLSYNGTDSAALARKAALENKVEVALYYTEKLGGLSNLAPDTQPFSADVVHDAAYIASQAALLGVTADASTVKAALARIDALVTPPRPDESGQPPDGPDEETGLSFEQALQKYQALSNDSFISYQTALDSFQAFASELGLPFDQNAFAFESYLAVIKQIENITQIFSERFPESDGFIDEDSYQPFFEQKVHELTERVQNATDVSLEDNADFYEALDAYNALADQVNLNVTKLEQQMNRLFVFDERGLDFEDVATYVSNQLTVTVSIFEPDDITFLLSECGDLVLQGDDAAIRAYHDLVGTQAFEAALQAVYDNYHEQQLAQEQVQSTLYAALSDLGYEFDSQSDLVANQLLELAQIAENGLINPLPDSQGKIIQVLDLMPSKLADGVEVWQWQKDIELLKKMDSIVVLGTDFFEKNDDFGDVAQMLTAAEMSFSAFGYSMVTAIDLLLDGVATGEIYDSSDPNQLPDVFVFSMIPLHTVENFDGKDLFYFGNLVQDFIPLTEPDNFDFMLARSPVVLGGQDDRIEIFAQQLGDDTRLYIEKDTAAGNTNDWCNLIEMTLLGVQVRDLVFDKGILSFNQDVLLG